MLKSHINQHFQSTKQIVIKKFKRKVKTLSHLIWLILLVIITSFVTYFYEINKNSLIIFGYSEILTLGLVVNSKLNKVKEFNILEDNNEDEFFKVISNFISNNACFNKVFYSSGPGGFTIIRRIISYVKALKFNNCSNTKFIGLNNLFIIANYLNLKSKINDNTYILSSL